MIPVLGIPTLNRGALLRRCLESIDHPVDRLVIVQNDRGHPEVSATVEWAETQAGEFHRWKRCEVITSTANFGVSGSWNTIIKLFPADYWMLVNDDIQFAPGDLAKMEAAANYRGDTACKTEAACFYANHGASFWIVTKLGVEQVGLFDENIHPAYLEDCDHSTRADRLGLPRVNVSGCASIHGENGRGSRTMYADPNLTRECRRTHGNNFVYYRAKWGGINEHETFKTPFNDPHWPIWAVKFDPKLRAMQQWRL